MARRTASKNWKLCSPGPTMFSGPRHISSYSTQQAAKKAVPEKFRGKHPNILPVIILTYMGQEVERWKNPRVEYE